MDLARFGPVSARSAVLSAEPGAKFGHVWPGLGPSLGDLDQPRGDFGRSRGAFDRCLPLHWAWRGCMSSEAWPGAISAPRLPRHRPGRGRSRCLSFGVCLINQWLLSDLRSPRNTRAVSRVSLRPWGGPGLSVKGLEAAAPSARGTSTIGFLATSAMAVHSAQVRARNGHFLVRPAVVQSTLAWGRFAANPPLPAHAVGTRRSRSSVRLGLGRRAAPFLRGGGLSPRPRPVSRPCAPERVFDSALRPVGAGVFPPAVAPDAVRGLARRRASR